MAFRWESNSLDQLHALCDPVAPQDTVPLVPILDGKPHAVVMIRIRSHLRRIFALLADRRDGLLAMAPVGCMLASFGQLASPFMDIDLMTSAIWCIGQMRWSMGVFQTRFTPDVGEKEQGRDLPLDRAILCSC